jgi:chloride channel 3/4/5
MLTCDILLLVITNAHPLYSPRVILVEDHGSLVGLVTVKDVLKFTATEEHANGHTGHARYDTGALDEAWDWMQDTFHKVVDWGQRKMRR